MLQRNLAHQDTQEEYAESLEARGKDLSEKNALLAASNDILRSENARLQERLTALTQPPCADMPPALISAVPVAPTRAASTPGTDAAETTSATASETSNPTERGEAATPAPVETGRRRSAVSNTTTRA